MQKRTKIDIFLLLIVTIGGVFALQNAVAIGDWWHFNRYEPQAEISLLADDAGMNEHGQRLFYRFSPRFVDQKVLDAECGDHALGCSSGASIYLLDETNQQDRYRSVVTASHEMLHVAYSRLSDEDKELLSGLLDEELEQLSNSKIHEQLQDFTGTEDYYNEAHSYIGTEEQIVTEKLDDYYAQYFDERHLTIEAYSKSPEF